METGKGNVGRLKYIAFLFVYLFELESHYVASAGLELNM